MQNQRLKQQQEAMMQQDMLQQQSLYPHPGLLAPPQILREGYRVEGDHLQPKPINPLRSSGDQPNNNNASGILSPNSDIPEAVSGQPSNEVAKPSDSGTNNTSMMTSQNMGNSMGQNPINMNQASSISNVISQQLRSGMITPAQAAIMTTKLRMAQSRNILGGASGQAGNITGLAGANRQETTSPLQAVLSPPQQQVGSPSMGIPQQQQASPQQMSQRTPMSPQLSSGAIHPPMSSGNQDGACPPSPQLSSQTMGSVSSMTNSPMDMQGVNKSS